MNQLYDITSALFKQIEVALNTITTEQYTHKHTLLQQSTIGQHVRHIIELFQEMQKGYSKGIINYELRERNLQIEIDPSVAISEMRHILQTMQQKDINLLLITNYIENEEPIITQSNMAREIIYNIEHTMHHMAIIRIAIKSSFNIDLEQDFGVAPSTIKYKKQCAQLA